MEKRVDIKTISNADLLIVYEKVIEQVNRREKPLYTLAELSIEVERRIDSKELP